MVISCGAVHVESTGWRRLEFEDLQGHYTTTRTAQDEISQTQPARIRMSFLGMPIEKIHKIEWGPFLWGMAASVLTHTAGHLIMLEYYDANYKVENLFLHEEYNGVTEHETRRIARAGFFAQHLVTTGLLSFKKTKDLDFTKGFATMSFLETLLYPLYNGNGDYNTIRRNGGDPDRDYLCFSVIATVNLFRVEW